MPCPYFEPQEVAAVPAHANARLPLIEEFTGMCRAEAEPFAAAADMRFRFCNHGNSRGQCGRFPAKEERSAVRYEVLRQSAATLDLLVVEERDYAPLRWQRVSYELAGEQLHPDTADICRRAQILAFCHSYLKRFPVHV